MLLSDITLCCIDNQYPELGFEALKRSTQHLAFPQVLFFTSSKFSAPSHSIANLQIIPIDFINNLETYSEFILKELGSYIQTSHVLIVQWDGFITHPHLWQERFLEFDYIGAPWPTPEGLIVGNGGFSLRSKKLLLALQDQAIVAKHPEDQCICLENRAYLEERHHIRFAPGDLAEQFAFELQKPSFACFGFHAVCNLPLVLTTNELLSLIDRLPPKLIFTEQFSQFIATCQSLKVPQVVATLKEKILTLTQSMSPEMVCSRLYRHIIKTCMTRQLYSTAFATLKTRTQLTGFNIDSANLFLRICFHRLTHIW